MRGRAALLISITLVAGCVAHEAESLPVAAPTSAPGIDTNPLSPQAVEAALDRASAYLLSKQDADGAWRSEIYGTFKDGPSYTPLILEALLAVPPSEKTKAAVKRAAAYLAGLTKPDGTVAPPAPLINPVYTGSLAIVVFSILDERQHDQARDAWIAYLKARQLTEQLGWEKADKPYGGWGYSTLLPRKPKMGEGAPPLTESNLSATLFAVRALRAAGVKADDAIFAKALIFIDRCQNWRDDAKVREAKFDDGGFFFIYDDPVRNKAGVAGKDATGADRYNSYGSVTADGIRAMLHCGRAKDHPRVQAARAWLEKHFRADSHPGHYSPPTERNREAVYFYYTASVALALRELDVDKLRTETGEIAWREALTAALLKRQTKDGTWINDLNAVREDDPLLATSFAVLALRALR
jgi:hypothetical protein